ncbi:MAG: PfkB family carbohydrate kinase [Saprospiraceae bacterium]
MVTSDDFFEQVNRLRILIVGDVMIDRYLTGKVDRISPEAPVPVVQLQAEENRLGGAANVALNIAAMGATPLLLSFTGEDDNGKTLQAILPDNHISSAYLITSPFRQTTVKTRVIAQQQHLLRVDREDTFPLNEVETSLLLNRFDEILLHDTPDLVLFQDYNKGVLTPHIIQHIIAKTQKSAIPTVVDPKFHNFWAYQGVTLFKPNLREIQQQMDGKVQANLESLQQAAHLIRTRLGNPYTMITLSEKGLFVADTQKAVIIPTRPRIIADVCGAGDTVISIVALGLACGLDMETTAKLANIAGGQVCERVGVVPVDKHTLRAEIERSF